MRVGPTCNPKYPWKRENWHRRGGSIVTTGAEIGWHGHQPRNISSPQRLEAGRGNRVSPGLPRERCPASTLMSLWLFAAAVTGNQYAQHPAQYPARAIETQQMHDKCQQGRKGDKEGRRTTVSRKTYILNLKLMTIWPVFFNWARLPTEKPQGFSFCPLVTCPLSTPEEPCF